MRENVAAKGKRYLTEGRLAVRGISEGSCGVTATCRGSGALYRCGWTPAAGWHCDCEARGECCHLVALKLVVFVPIHEAAT